MALDRIMSIRVPSVFQSAFDEVQEEHDHTIRTIATNKKWLYTFNCYAFALGIVDSPRYQALVQKHRNGALANSGFMSALLARGELIEINEKHPKLNVAAFGEDAEGEVYILAFDGRIYKFVSRP